MMSKYHFNEELQNETNREDGESCEANNVIDDVKVKRKFQWKRDMKQHESIHTGDKFLICNVCEKKSTTRRIKAGLASPLGGPYW